MARTIILLGIAVIITDISVFLLTRRVKRQEDTTVQVLLALAILFKEYDKKKSKVTKKEK